MKRLIALMFVMSVGVCSASVSLAPSPGVDTQENIATREMYSLLEQRPGKEPFSISWRPIQGYELLVRVRALVGKGAYFDEPWKHEVVQWKKMTPLHHASDRGEEGVAKFLVEKNPKLVLIKDKNRFSAKYPAELAAKNKHNKLAAYLIGKMDITGRNLIARAARNGNWELVGELMKQKVLVKKDSRNSVVRLAAENGHPQVIEVMIENGYDLKSEPDDALLKKILNVAQKGWNKIVTALIDTGRVSKEDIVEQVTERKKEAMQPIFFPEPRQERVKEIVVTRERIPEGKRKIELQQPLPKSRQILISGPELPREEEVLEKQPVGIPDSGHRPRFTPGQNLAIGGTAVGIGAVVLFAAYLIYRKFRKKTLTKDEMDEWIRKLHELRQTDWDLYEEEVDRLRRTVKREQVEEILDVFEGGGGGVVNPRLVEVIG